MANNGFPNVMGEALIGAIFGGSVSRALSEHPVAIAVGCFAGAAAVVYHRRGSLKPYLEYNKPAPSALAASIPTSPTRSDVTALTRKAPATAPARTYDTRSRTRLRK